jgi:ankyrin repeat protein
LEYGPNDDAIGFRGKAPLHLAAASKEVIRLLRKKKTTSSIRDDAGSTILYLALKKVVWWMDISFITVIKDMLSSGANVNLKNKLGQSPLHTIVPSISNQILPRYTWTLSPSS